MIHTDTSFDTLRPLAPPIPRVLSFDPTRVVFAGEYVHKQTGPEEYANILAATEFLAEHPMTLSDGTEIRVVPIIGYDQLGSSSGCLTLEFCDGVNLETLLREQGATAHVQGGIATLIADFIRTAAATGFGWHDMAPRNMLLEFRTGVPNRLTLLDFEKPSHFGNSTPAWWTRTLHGYTREELSCLFPLAVVDEMLRPYDDAAHEPEYLSKDQIYSSRKLALLASILSGQDFAADTFPTEIVRRVEHAMAVAAQPTFVDGRLEITMDTIEDRIRCYGLQWYVDYVHSKNPELSRTQVLTSDAAPNHASVNKVVQYISPTGYNTVTERLDETQGVLHYHLERPGVDVQIPIGPNIYTPAKTAADIAAVLADYYKDSLVGLDGLELGCGDHAVLAHTLHALGTKRTIATDIDPKAVGLVQVYGNPAVECRQSDIFSAIQPDERLDIIIFNAPQMPMPNDERAALTDWHDSPGNKGYEIILAAIADTPNHLKQDGKLVMMIFDFLMSDGVIAEQARQCGLRMQTIGTLVKPVRKGGQTEKSLDYIRSQFPGLEVREDDAHGQHITCSLIEFTLDN